MTLRLPASVRTRSKFRRKAGSEISAQVGRSNLSVEEITVGGGTFLVLLVRFRRRRAVLESDPGFLKDHAYLASGPVALLADDQLGFDPFAGVSLLARLLAPPLAVDENHDVGILLDRTRLTQVPELRRTTPMLLRRAAELGKRQHRNAQLFGDAFELARNVTDLLSSILKAPVAGGELQVVNNQKVQPFFCFQPARFGSNLQNAQAGSIFDEQRSLRQASQGSRHLAPVLAAGKAGAKFVAVDARLRAQKADHQRFLAHFE